MLENQIDILALNETYLKPKHRFHLPGYDIYRNDRFYRHQSWRSHLGEKGIIVNQEWKNDQVNVITDNVALGIEIEFQNGENGNIV